MQNLKIILFYSIEPKSYKFEVVYQIIFKKSLNYFSTRIITKYLPHKLLKIALLVVTSKTNW